jgi:hypothetical protein
MTKGILEAASAAMDEVETFGLTMDFDIEMRMEGFSLAMPITFVGDFQAPDSKQYVMTMTMLGETVVMQGISIEDTTCIRNPVTGLWEISTEASSPIAPEEVASVDLDELTGLEYVGEETLDGTPVHHVAADVSAGALLDDAAPAGWTGPWVGQSQLL